MGMEGAHQIDASMGALRMMYKLGVRYMTLTHTCNNPVADSCANECSDPVDCRVGQCAPDHVCTEPQTVGVTPFGSKVLKEMNRLGMLIDLSHVTPQAMRKAISESRAPVIFSHSAAFALCDNDRNVPTDVLELLPHQDGVVMVTFVDSFVACGKANATLDTVADHIDYIVRGKCPSWRSDCNPGAVFKGIGASHVGYGSDFDGAAMPRNLETPARFVNLTAELFRYLIRVYCSC